MLRQRALLGLLLVATFLETRAAAAPLRVVITQDRALSSVKLALDVAWVSADDVVIAAAMEGVLRVRVRTGAESVEVQGSRRPGSRTIWATNRIAADHGLVAVAPPLGTVSWFRNDGALITVPFADPRDLDLIGSQVLVAGVLGEGGRWGRSAPGATLWSAFLGAAPTGFDAVGDLATPSALVNCAQILNSVVARMPNGTFAVASGVAPGVSLHDERGRVIRSWSTAALGYQDHCSLTYEQSNPLVGDAIPRFGWLNRRDTLEDIVATIDGPLLILRHPRPNKTTWRGILLPFSGAPVPVDIPLESPSTHALLRAAANGTSVAFVIHEFPLRGEAVLKSRLVTGRLQR